MQPLIADRPETIAGETGSHRDAVLLAGALYGATGVPADRRERIGRASLALVGRRRP